MKHYFCGLLSLGISLCSPLSIAQDISDFNLSQEYLLAIEADWDHRVDEFSASLVSDFEEPVFMRLEAPAGDTAREELVDSIRRSIGWETMSSRILSSLDRACGSELLMFASSSFSSGESVSDEKQNEYASCYSSALTAVESGALMGLMQDPGLMAVLGKYEDMLASYQRISPALTTASVENRYGRMFDDVIGLFSLTDDPASDTLGQELTRRLENEQAIWSVELQGAGEVDIRFVPGLLYRQPGLPPSSGSACSGSSPAEQERMIRCTWKGDGLGEDNIIKYSRPFTYGDERLLLIVNFNYAELLAAVAQ